MEFKQSSAAARCSPRSPSRRRAALGGLLSAAVVGIAALLSLRTGGQPAARAASNLPPGWPATLQLGMADGPGGAAALKAIAPFGFRYQYLAGGVNTGSGWATWNAGGAFATYYIQDSIANSITPVFTYYQIRQSTPGASLSETQGVAANFQNTSTMAAYYQDLTLFFQKAAAFPQTHVVLHVEPDAWGYIEQQSTNNSAATVPVQVAATGNADLAGLPNTAAGFAQAIKRLRDKYAPNVLLGYHLSVWGTGDDILYSRPADSVVVADAQKAAAFEQSLGTSFDLTFAEATDRDAAFKQYQYGDGGASWWSAADYARNVLFLQTFHAAVPLGIVDWQLPLGNTRMRAMNNTWDHYQDNHVEWWLADSTRQHLQSYVNAGVVALLFGRGADGATCACDAAGDGVTNPAAINGNTTASLNADDDGGFFRQQAQAYYAAGALSLGGSSTPTPTPSATASPSPTPSPTASPTPSPTPMGSFTTSASVSPASVAAGSSEGITATVKSNAATTVLVDLEVYDAGGRRVFQKAWDNQAFSANKARSFTTSWNVPAGQAPGTYTVEVGIFTPGWGQQLAWNESAKTFTVTAAQPSFTTSAVENPASVARGASVGITATVKSATALNALIDLEVYDASGNKVFQKFWDNQAFSAGQTRTFAATWAVPASQRTGGYTVKIGVFAPGWASMYTWNDSAGTFSVT